MRTFKKLFFCGLLICVSNQIIFSQTTSHVVLVIIDGARYSETFGDSLARYTPHMQQLAQQGATADNMINDNKTFTKYAIPAIWSGSWSVPKDTIVNGVANQYATSPTVWEYFRKDRGVDSIHAMYIMVSLSSPWIQSFHKDYGPRFWPWYLLQGSTDWEVWQNAKSKLETYHPELTVIYLSDVDSAPAYGWEAYTQAITTADNIVGSLWDLIQNDPVYSNTTTLFVTNDHGRHLDNIQNGFRGHGDNCWGCQHVMFFGVGGSIPKGLHTSTRCSITDITPTIGSLLNFSTPYSTGNKIMEILTSVGSENQYENINKLPCLRQNFPNPLNPSTVIEYSIPQTVHVRLKIYNTLGQEVVQLVDQVLVAGTYKNEWNASKFASGVYFYRLTAGNFISTKKLLLIK